ncbi:MAG: AAA family ATPase [Nitriliruptorales bacterium]|nr:AAA family ATPase [Nitriliruptorales bacterium]
MTRPARATITIGGLAGTGTSTLASLLGERFGLDVVSGGQIFREAARDRGLTLAAFGTLCEENPEVDRGLDERQIELLRQGGLVLESRLGGWLAHREGITALKVCLKCDEDERIRRIVAREGGDLEEQRRRTLEREASEAARYSQYYALDLHSFAPYDLVLDSGRWNPEQLADLVAAAIDTA